MRLPQAGVLVLAICFASLARDQDLTAKQRIWTARELARQGSDAIPQLQALLADPVAEVRMEAVKAIVEIDTPRSLEPLIQATRDNHPEVQMRATDGLVNFYLPGYVQSGRVAPLRKLGTAIKGRFTDLTDQVVDPYVKVPAEVVAALGGLARGGASMEARANAARAVGILRGSAAVPDLIDALRSSKDDQVILESLIALQKIKDPSAAPKITFLLGDLKEKVQIAALETTGLLGNREALPQLHEALERARNARIRRAALTAIAMLPDPQNRPLYTRCLADRDDGLRAAAAEGLARLQAAADLPLLEKAFNDEPGMSPRLSLAFALVMLGKTEVSEFSPLQYLLNTLNSSAWRGVARAFLIELSRQQPVRRALEQATRPGTREEKMQLAQILAHSGDAGSIACLEALAHDPDTAVAQQGVIALKSLKSRLP